MINGNLSDAKIGAVNKSTGKLRTALMEEYGYSDCAASLAALWLKGKGSFQAICDQLGKDNNKGKEGQ